MYLLRSTTMLSMLSTTQQRSSNMNADDIIRKIRNMSFVLSDREYVSQVAALIHKEWTDPQVDSNKIIGKNTEGTSRKVLPICLASDGLT